MDRHVISEGDCVVRVNIVGLVGVQGLRSAFFVAGAEAQVMTLWKVSDEATVGLISRYYGRLRDGSGRAAALRESQLAMLQDAPHADPYFWAGFVPSGDWRPVAP